MSLTCRSKYCYFKVRDLVPESQAYMDLLAFERKLDATIMRKRLDIQEALKRPMKVGLPKCKCATSKWLFILKQFSDSSSSIIPDQIWIFESWCSWRWENWSTWRKRSQGKEENLPQTWPTWGIGSGPGIHQTIFKHMCQQLSWIIWESLGYDTNLLVSHTGHQISRIKSSYELFRVCFNFEFIPFSPKIRIFFDSQFRFWGIFVRISPLTKMNSP